MPGLEVSKKMRCGEIEFGRPLCKTDTFLPFLNQILKVASTIEEGKKTLDGIALERLIFPRKKYFLNCE